ncbi:hypothetical protein KIW84_014538 [Lathyrus oleraceus]|uniref:Uncharacterized protein n=1 Tax=Pisum sativum TaxID=3888 RepID=A0A9D5BMZ0_PEA|nr:hypothetical protein KIW84_014538 [Pisum sativum]
MVEPLPVVTKVFSPVLQQERQLGSTIIIEPAKILFTKPTINKPMENSNKKQGKGRGRPNFQGRGVSNFKVCSLCGKTGHTLDACYFKHEFPPRFRFKDKVSSSNNVEISAEDQDQHIQTNDQDTKVEITLDMYNKLAAVLSKSEESRKSDSHINHTYSSGTTFTEDD